jgi:hypothetical protein
MEERIMSRGKIPAAKAKNHQWRRKEPFDELWFSRLGHRPNDGLHEETDALALPATLPWGRLPVLPLAPVVGGALLESRVHVLVGAMAAFTSTPFGPTAHAPWNGPAFVPVGIASAGTGPSLLP